jgi:hypothetical protein
MPARDRPIATETCWQPSMTICSGTQNDAEVSHESNDPNLTKTRIPVPDASVHRTDSPTRMEQLYQRK